MIVIMVKISNKTKKPSICNENSFKEIPYFLRSPYILYYTIFKIVINLMFNSNNRYNSEGIKNIKKILLLWKKCNNNS